MESEEDDPKRSKTEIFKNPKMEFEGDDPKRSKVQIFKNSKMESEEDDPKRRKIETFKSPKMEFEGDDPNRSKIQIFKNPKMEFEGDDPKSRKTSQHSPLPSTSMQDSIPTLPPELITEIFSRLPVKSLLQFRCVSKYWLAEISSPQFIKNHLRLSFNDKEYTHHMLTSMLNPGLGLQSCTLRSLIYQNATEAFDLDYPMRHDYLSWKLPRSDWILGSVNGLICLAAGKKDLFIGNPSIRKYRKLSGSRPRLKRPAPWPRYSFGYDELHDDYKVVGVFPSYDSSDQDEVYIYSLKSDSWRAVDGCPSEIRLHGSGKFLNGKIHWATTPGLNVNNGRNIYSFDLTDEKWRKTVEQPSYRGRGLSLWLTVLASDLSIFFNYEGTHLDVWVMKEYGVKESWTMMFTIKCPGNEVEICHLYRPLFFMSKKGEILVVLGSINMIYNPKDESMRYSELINFKGDYEGEIYVESLVSPFLTEEREDATKNKRLKKVRSRKSSNKNLEVNVVGKQLIIHLPVDSSKSK